MFKIGRGENCRIFERETKRTVRQWRTGMRVGAAAYGRCHAEGRALCTVQGSRCSRIRGRTVPLCDAVSVELGEEALGPSKIVEQAWLSDDPTCSITCVRGE